MSARLAQAPRPFAADIGARVHGRGAGPVLTDRERRRLRLSRIATVAPWQGLPRDDDEIRVAVAGAADLGWAFVAVRELERRGEVTLPVDDAERVLCAAASATARRVVRRTNDLPVEVDVLAVVGMVVTAAAGQRRFRDSPIPARAGILAALAGRCESTAATSSRRSTNSPSEDWSCAL
ncbi:hypothetical protein ABT297_20895 [Dactylosporangium sp. NPDC000555]|uniref:hypothetical protein n=1 Tax=Dactylosporangium sp. NPDC000555 TaxID=3154260 RepID=UPI00332A1662